MASIVKEIDRLGDKWKKELVELLYEASGISDRLLYRTSEIQNRTYTQKFHLKEGNIERRYSSGHVTHDKKTLTIEDFVYKGLSLDEVRKVAKVLKNNGFN